jgi:2-polyprenyl-3-methyl-5-hydroxy-6-metoxy-1,4-benzoquinol methylase
MASIGDDITRKLIERGEIKSGMKILDLGCGDGNVTFLLSNYVGPEGIVVGIDSNENAIGNAKKKSKEFGLSNLYFIVGDITQDFKIEHSNFDVIIVRRVLMYLSNPQSTIATAMKYLKPNGIFLAQENNISKTPIGLESMPHHKKINDLIRKTLERENVNINLGFELCTILTDSGLKVENVWAEAVLSTPSQPTPWFFLAQVMKDRMLTHKVISDVSELELETLGERLTNERMENTRTFISDLVFCAVARKA